MSTPNQFRRSDWGVSDMEKWNARLAEILGRRIGTTEVPPVDWAAVDAEAAAEWRRDKATILLGRLSERHRDAVPRHDLSFRWLKAYADGRMVNLAITGQVGTGKGHPLTTRVLTPTGWRQVGALQVGDSLIGADGTPTTVRALYDRGELPVYRVMFNDRSSVLVDADHLWSVTGRDVVATRDLQAGMEIPMVAPVEMTETVTPLHPYVMGVLLGDGCFPGHANLTVSTDHQTLARFESLLPDGVKLNRQGKHSARVVARPGQRNVVLDEIRRVGLDGHLAADKFVPDEYLFNTAERRLWLLQGLMDTDGELSRRDNAVTPLTAFSSASQHLRDAVTFLVESFGGVARNGYRAVTRYRYAGEVRTGQPAHRVNINMPVCPFATRPGWTPHTKYLPRRRVLSVTPEGTAPVRCLSVTAPDALYVTERCIVTHNTWEAAAIVRALLLDAHVPAQMTSVPDMLDKLRPTADGASDIGQFQCAPVLALDDLGAEKRTEWTDEQLFRVADFRHTRNLPTIITSNLSPDELTSRYGDRLCRRLFEDAAHLEIKDIPPQVPIRFGAQL